jgi:hypothetical protein
VQALTHGNQLERYGMYAERKDIKPDQARVL